MSSAPAMPAMRGGGKSAPAILLAVSLITAVLATAEIGSAWTIGQDWSGFVSFTLLAWLAAYTACSWVYFGSPYLFTSAYLLAVAIFHLGLLVPYALSLVDVPSWNGSDGRWYRLAGWYVALAFGSFGVAFSTVCLRWKRPRADRERTREQAQQLSEWNLFRIRNLSIGLAIAAGVALLIATLQLGNLLAYSRFDLFFRSSDPRFLSLFFYLGPTAAIGLVTTARTKPQRIASYVYAACILLVVLLSGNRSWAFFPLLAGAVVWAKIGRRIPLAVAAAAVPAVLVIIPTIAMIRTLGTYEDMSMKAIERAQDQSKITDALFEMGSTLGTLAVTLEYIPEEEPYRYGRQFLIYLDQAIPNIGLSARRQYARDVLYQRLMSDPDAVLELEPSDWTSWKVIPESFLTGAGTGYSAVAEPYFAFGPVGVVIWFMAIGAFLARMDHVNLRLHFNWLVFATFFFWSLPVTCRNSFGVFSKPGALILAVLGIWVLVRRFTPLRIPRRPRRRLAVSH